MHVHLWVSILAPIYIYVAFNASVLLDEAEFNPTIRYLGRLTNFPGRKSTRGSIDLTLCQSVFSKIPPPCPFIFLSLFPSLCVSFVRRSLVIGICLARWWLVLKTKATLAMMFLSPISARYFLLDRYLEFVDIDDEFGKLVLSIFSKEKICRNPTKNVDDKLIYSLYLMMIVTKLFVSEIYWFY